MISQTPSVCSKKIKCTYCKIPKRNSWRYIWKVIKSHKTYCSKLRKPMYCLPRNGKWNNVCTTYNPTGVPYHFQTLYRKPRSSPQVTMLLPVEARRKHYQDQISRGRRKKHRNKNRKRDIKRTHRKCKVKKNKAQNNSLFKVHGKQNLTCVLSK